MDFISKIKSFAQSEYSRLIEASSCAAGFPGPPQIMRFWNSLVGYFTSRFVLESVGAGQRILLAGDGGGRDYWYLRWHKKHPVSIDIAEQLNIPKEDSVITDLNCPLPFRNGTFDAVVIMDVLEHLIDDAFALREFHRVLKPEGVLIASVPFLHDGVEHHVRIHTFHTLRRLLNATGFTITNCVMRGGLLLLENLRAYFILKTILNYLTFLLTGKPIYHIINERLFKLQSYIARTDNLIIRLARPPLYGCYVRCEKGNVMDFSEMNRADFENMQSKMMQD